MSKLKVVSILGIAALAATTLSATNAAAVVPEFQMTGVFSDPVYLGNVLNTPAVGESTFYDNSGTAPASTIISPDGSTLQWGTNPPTDVGTVFSQLQFTGALLPLGDTSTPTQLGTITYTNGTSSLDTLIFGATLTFSLDGIVLGSDDVIITTTSNQSSGTDLNSCRGAARRRLYQYLRKLEQYLRNGHPGIREYRGRRRRRVLDASRGRAQWNL